MFVDVLSDAGKWVTENACKYLKFSCKYTCRSWQTRIEFRERGRTSNGRDYMQEKESSKEAAVIESGQIENGWQKCWYWTWSILL